MAARFSLVFPKNFANSVGDESEFYFPIGHLVRRLADIASPQQQAVLGGAHKSTTLSAERCCGPSRTITRAAASGSAPSASMHEASSQVIADSMIGLVDLARR
jgi:hypothetical protein